MAGGVLLAAMAVLAAYLGDCLPGGGLGPGADAGKADEAEEAPKADAEQPAAGASAVVVVKGESCAKDGGEAGDCTKLCASLTADGGPTAVIVDGTAGAHATVVELVDCLEKADRSVSLKED